MKKLSLVLLINMISLLTLQADSPLTSTDLTAGYLQSKYVLEAKAAHGIITQNLIEFLAGTGSPGEKMAVINSLGWGDNAMDNAKAFEKYLDDHPHTADLNETRDEFLCMAYLYALGDYFNMKLPKMYIQKGLQNNNNSFTYHMIYALIMAQEFLDNSNRWCDVYKVCDAVRKNTGYTKDMEEASVNGIFEYIGIYKAECK